MNFSLLALFALLNTSAPDKSTNAHEGALFYEPTEKQLYAITSSNTWAKVNSSTNLTLIASRMFAETKSSTNAFTHIGPTKEMADYLDLKNDAETVYIFDTGNWTSWTNLLWSTNLVLQDYKPSEADLKREREVLKWFAGLGDGYRGKADFSTETFIEYRNEGIKVLAIRLGFRSDGVVVWKKEHE